MKRKVIIFFLILIFTVNLGTISNISLGESNTKEYTISFTQPVTIGQKLSKFINDQKVKTHSINIEYIDTKGQKINPDQTIYLKDGTKYDLLNRH